MGARIIQLAEVRARRLDPAQDVRSTKAEARLIERFHFWSGASAKRYVHTVYSLLECPEISSGTFVLVRRDEQGRREALTIGRLSHATASLNLAEIRQRGAMLGANEVHIHLLAATDHDMKLVEFDLRTGQLAQAEGAIGTSTTRH